MPRADLAPITIVHASDVLHFNGGLPTQPIGPEEEDPVYTSNTPSWPSVHGFFPDGTQACRTSIVGWSPDGLGNPDGLPCEFAPTNTRLHSFVNQNRSWHLKLFLAGMEPFVSATPEEWFDPREYPSPPLTQFLVPRD